MRLSHHKRRGSAFILVLALLSVLVLAVITLSYTSRLESVASHNFASAMQARSSALAGLPVSLPMLAEATSVTTTLQRWNLASRQPASDAALRQRDGGDGTRGTAGADLSQSTLRITDLGSRVNLNTIRSERALARFLGALASGANRQGAVQGAQARAKAILRHRGDSGPASGSAAGRNPDVNAGANTGAGNDDSATRTLQPDLRLPPGAQAARYETLSDLERRRGKPDLLLPGEIESLSNYVTLFSQSPEVYNAPDGTSRPKVALDEKLNYQAVYDALKAAFPDKDRRLLIQFACNVADMADADSVPTVAVDSEHPEPWNCIFGVEQTPFITEVYPDSVTIETDEGQFVELYNPWDKPLTLSNWRLVVGGGMSAAGTIPGSSVLINAVIQPGGYIVITDNYDKPAQDAAPDTGCFLSVFGRQRDGAAHQLIDSPVIALQDRNSYVTLVDGQGRPVDVFSYTDTAGRDSRRSYNRTDPRVHSFVISDASPFEQAPAMAGGGKPAASGAADQGKRWKFPKEGVKSPADLLKVPTSFVALRSRGSSAAMDPHPWQVPAIKGDETTRKDPNNLDVRVTDIFTKPQVWAAPMDLNARQRDWMRQRDAAGGVTVAGDADTTTPQVDGVLYAYGKLNVNTCPLVALYSLDAEVDGKDWITPDLASRFENHRATRLRQGNVPFLNTSDFLVALFPTPSESDLQAFGKILDQITVSSSSFEVVSESRAAEQSGERQSRQPAAASSKWVVSVDRAPCSLVGFGSRP